MREIADRLEASIDSLVIDNGPVRARISEIQDQLSIELITALTPAIYLESYQIQVTKARQRIHDRQAFSHRQAALDVATSAARQKKEELDSASAALPVLSSKLEKLEKHKAELEALLSQVTDEIASTRQEISDQPQVIASKKEQVKAAILHARNLQKDLQPISGSDANDAALINEADQIRLRAINAINNFLTQ